MKLNTPQCEYMQNSHCAFGGNTGQGFISYFEVLNPTNSDTVFDAVSICLSTSEKNDWTAAVETVRLVCRWSWSKLWLHWIMELNDWECPLLLWLPWLACSQVRYVRSGAKHLCYHIQVNPYSLNPLSSTTQLYKLCSSPKKEKIEKEEFDQLRSHWIQCKTAGPH